MALTARVQQPRLPRVNEPLTWQQHGTLALPWPKALCFHTDSPTTLAAASS